MSKQIAETKKNILLISTDLSLRDDFRETISPQYYQLYEAADQSDAISVLEHQKRIDMVFVDLQNLPAMEIDLVHYIRTSHHAEIIVLASLNQLDEAGKTLRNGASFYLIKPVNMKDIKAVVDKIAARTQTNLEQRDMEQRFLFDLMAGSPAMQKLLKFSMKIAPTTSNVLIGGESGTGKEFFAKIIHRMSKRSDGRFIAINCGAIPETLFESELFGHKKGSFTGADRDKSGLVEEAHTGTLFLDEVGELSPAAQVKLLRFLQDRQFRRVGENLTRTADVRIIAATNRDLRKLIEQGTFREDLFYRLNVFYIYLPPLRERKDTIPALVHLFLHRYNELFDKDITRLSKSAETVLVNYGYPGNVRELENVIEHAVVLAENNEINERDLPEFMFRNRLLLGPPSTDSAQPVGQEILTLAEMEKIHIQFVLGMTNYNYTETSKKLGVSRSTLWRKIKEYGIEEK